MHTREDLRNIAIIAHVDHGKTTLVDQMLRQSGTFRKNEQVAERVMDSNDLERERGITILAKNTAVRYGGVKINIIDTPGHADFGGEVERVLAMVDGVLLLVDAFEGVMPQTRFVLQKALGMNKKAVVVINKIDRPDARPEAVVDEILNLFIDLNAGEELLEFPVVYASARDGWASLDAREKAQDIRALFEAIIEHVPAPAGDVDAPFQVLFSNIDYDDYVGRIGIGRVERGHVQRGQAAVLCDGEGGQADARISRLYQFEGLKRVEVEQAAAGDIVAVTGMGEINIGQCACDPEHPEAIAFTKIDEPTLSMLFMVNNSPFAGREGKYVTSRNLRERLYKETLVNVSLRVENTDSTDAFNVCGRGELHLSILIETMRREGYEFAVSRPQVIFRNGADGQLLEPIERLVVDAPEAFCGVVIEKIGARRGELLDMAQNGRGGMRLEFLIPARGLMGYRGEMMTDTKGNGVMNHLYEGYAPYKGPIGGRGRGSIIAFEAGQATSYGLNAAQERGRLFISPGEAVYEGMIVGENARAEDLAFNVCRKKHVTNIRSSNSDEAYRLSPPIKLSLEQTLEFIADDELVEVTPKSIRMRKSTLSKEGRMKLFREQRDA